MSLEHAGGMLPVHAAEYGIGVHDRAVFVEHGNAERRSVEDRPELRFGQAQGALGLFPAANSVVNRTDS